MKKSKKFLKGLEKLVEEQPNPKTEQPIPDQLPQESAISDRRKRALVNYLAVLFGAAFLVVGISLVATWRDSRNQIQELTSSATSAMSKVEALQEENYQMSRENQSLVARNQELLQQMEEQNYDVQEYMEANAQEYLEAQAQQYAQQEKERMITVYSLLLQAQKATEQRDVKAFDQAMSQLAPLKENLDPVGLERYELLENFDWNA